MDFGALVRDRRWALKLSQGSVAREAGTSRQWIVDLEKGKPRVPLSLVLRTLAALGITLTPGEAAAGKLPESRQAGKKGQKKIGQAAADVRNIDQLLKKFRRRK